MGIHFCYLILSTGKTVSYEVPNVQMKLLKYQKQRRSVMIWCPLSNKAEIGPYFFKSKVYNESPTKVSSVLWGFEIS